MQNQYTITRFNQVKPLDNKCISTGFAFIDEPLNGGLPIGGAFFLAGSPGSGKSTIATQIIGSATDQGLKVLYIAGEEHPGRQLDRFKRLGVNPGDNLTFYTAQHYYIEDIIAYINQNPIGLLIIDSIQKVKSTTSKGEKVSVKKAINILYNYLQYSNPHFALLAVAQCTKSGEIEGFNSSKHEFDGLIKIINQGDNMRTFFYEKNRFGVAGNSYEAFLSPSGFTKREPPQDMIDPYPYKTQLYKYFDILKNPSIWGGQLFTSVKNHKQDILNISKKGAYITLKIVLLPFRLIMVVVKIALFIFFAVFLGMLFNIVFFKPQGNTGSELSKIISSL